MAKRMNGEGNIRRRKDGRWEYREMCGYRDDGSRNIVTFYGRTQKEVKEKVEAHRANKRDGVLTKTGYTFEKWADVWFDHHKRTISEVTQESYKYTLRILKNYFGSFQLEEIKTFNVESFIYELKDSGKADSGVAQCRGMLFQILNMAVANDLIRKNPVAYAQKTRSTKPPKEKPCFTAEEVQRLMRELPLDQVGLAIRLMLGTGIRGQELLGLETANIEPDGSEVRIVQATKKIKGTTIIGDPKNAKSYRHIPVPHNLRPYVVMLRNNAKPYVLESPKKKGYPCSTSHLEDLFKAALEQVGGVQILPPHCCRHTYVTQLQSLGVDINTIQSLVGHSAISMTQHYLHVQRPVQEVAVASFSDRFVPKLEGIT